MRSYEILKNTFDASNDAIIVTDNNLNIIELNSGAEFIFKYKKEELIGKNVEYLIPIKYRKYHDEKVAKFNKSTKTAITLNLRETISGLRSNGEVFPAILSINKNYSNGTKGDIEGYTVILRDISEAVNKENELYRHIQMLKIATEEVGLYVYEVNLKSNKVYYSRHCDFIFNNDEPTIENYQRLFVRNLYPDDIEIIDWALERLKTLHKPIDAQLRFIRNDGKFIWAKINAEPVIDSNGDLISIIGSIQDVSHPVVRKQKLKDIANRLELAIESAGISVFDRDYYKNQIYIIQNSSNLLDPNYTVESFPDALIERILPEYRDECWQKIEQSIIGDTKLSHNFKMFDYHNNEVWVNLTMRTVCDNDGEVIRIVGALRNISEEINTQAQIRYVADRYRIAAQSAGMTVIEVDFKNDNILVESSFEDDLAGNYSLNDFTKILLNRIHPLDMLKASSSWRKCRKGNGKFSLEYREIGKKGDIRWISTTGEFIDNEGDKRSKFIGTRRDITMQRQQQQKVIDAKNDAERANMAKSKFLAAMSHDMRTPLNGILGILQIFPRDNLNEHQKSLLETCLNGGTFMSARIDDILDLTKIEQGLIELNLRPFNIETMLKNLTGIFEADIKRNNVNFVVNTTKAKGEFIGDAVRIQQILDNIVSNAIKYTRDGKVVINATYSNGNVEFTVRDEGIGMDSETAQKLYSLHSWNDNMIAGSGIGLAICHQLTKVMNGTISSESHEGEGLTVHLTLPLKRIKKSAETTIKPDKNLIIDQSHTDNNGNSSENSGDDEDIKILVAEDNPTNQIVIRAMLNQINIDPIFVWNGQQAIDKYKDTRFDVILMDIKMPILDGLSATKEIRKIETNNGRTPTPIIAVTANALREQIEEYLSNGFNAVVPKPINISTLFGVLEDALN